MNIIEWLIHPWDDLFFGSLLVPLASKCLKYRYRQDPDAVQARFSAELKQLVEEKLVEQARSLAPTAVMLFVGSVFCFLALIRTFGIV